MNTHSKDVAASLLLMPADDFHAFIRNALFERRLHSVVHELNEQALSPGDRRAATAREALARIGFTA